MPSASPEGEKKGEEWKGCYERKKLKNLNKTGVEAVVVQHWRNECTRACAGSSHRCHPEVQIDTVYYLVINVGPTLTYFCGQVGYLKILGGHFANN